MDEYNSKLVTIRPSCLNASFLKKAGFSISRVSVDKIYPFWLRVMFSYDFTNRDYYYKTKYPRIGGRSFSSSGTNELNLEFPELRYRWTESSTKRRMTSSFGIDVIVPKYQGVSYDPKYIEQYKWRVACYFANPKFSSNYKELISVD